MDKYTLLVILNTPFIIFGILRAFVAYQKKNIKLTGLVGRIIFWVAIFLCLLFAQGIYDFLVVRHLTDSSPLSIIDVITVTGIIFCLSLILRLYAKQDDTERTLTQLQQELSIVLSEKAQLKTSNKKHSKK